MTERTIVTESGVSSPEVISPSFRSIGGDSHAHLPGLLSQLVLDELAEEGSIVESADGPMQASEGGSQASTVYEDIGVESVRAHSTAGSNGFWGTSRTVLSQDGPEVVRQGNETFNLHSLLRQLVSEDTLGSSLAATAQRMLNHGSAAGGQQLSIREIEALPKVRFEAEKQTCAICLEEYKPKELLTALRCGHCFHTPCLIGWLRRSPCCPLCRALQCPPEEGSKEASSPEAGPAASLA